MLKQKPPGSQEFLNSQINLRTYNKILWNSIRTAKKSYYNSCFQKYSSNIKKTWSTINHILNKNACEKQFPSHFVHNNRIITDKKEIANSFNDHFINIEPSLSQNIDIDRDHSHRDYLERYPHNFEIVTENHVMKIIDNLPNKSSYGHDNLSLKLMKSAKIPLCKYLTIIINQMLKTGVFPDNLKIAKVVPIYKKGNQYSFSNYRPISILPSISKIFEKVIYNQIYNYFVNNNLFFSSQYGFRAGHSTELAVLEIVDRIIFEMDKGHSPLSVFLDLSEAFDTINHDILLDKLNNYGIKGIPYRLCASYLRNRKQYLCYNNTDSDLQIIKTGLPQGSVLGPLMFIIYMNDIAKVSHLFKFIN